VLFLKPITNISSDIQIYFIKTNNGRYYSTYIENGTIGYYPIEINSSIIQDFKLLEGNDLKDRYKHHFKGLFTYMMEFKIGDLILITSYRNKKVSIGEISRINREGMIYTIQWLKEVNVTDCDALMKYLHRKDVVLNISELKTLILRQLYPYYSYNGKYHLVLQIKQKNNLLLKSLLGLQQMILERTNEQEMEIKIRLESPGIIEFISEHVDVILLIVKLIGLFKQFKNCTSLNEQEQALYEAYCLYQIDTLEVELEAE
jgi:N-dimethylarginine dimethylaminohydrolase